MFLSVSISTGARLAQLVERKALNLVVVGSSPTVGDFIYVTSATFSSFYVMAFLFWAHSLIHRKDLNTLLKFL